MKTQVLFVALLLAVTAPVFAATQQSPKQIVAALYKPYIEATNAEKSGHKSAEKINPTPGALDLIFPNASKALQAAIRKDHECEQREQGICNIDFDIIINAQDWDITKVTLKEDVKNQLPVVEADFLNGTQQKVSYFFVRENDEWKIDDVEAIRYKKNGKIERKYELKKSLEAPL